MSEPTKRLSLLSTIEQMKQIVKNIKKKDSDSLIKLLKPVVQTEDYSNSIKKLQIQHEYNEELNDKVIMNNQMNKV